MKNLTCLPFRRAFGFFLGVIAIAVLAGCDTIKRYSIQSYQGSMPMPDQRYVENFR